MKNFVREFVLLLVILFAGTYLLWSGPEKSETRSLPSENSGTAEIPLTPTPATAEVDAVSQPPLAQKNVRSEISAEPPPATTAGKAESTGKVETTAATSTEVQRRDTVIRVTGLKAQRSNLLIAVFESPAGFPRSDQSTHTTTIEAEGENVELSLSLPINCPIAIAVFQDLDGNKMISKSSIGIPIEPYGFSNNARGLFGPPTFQQSVVRLKEGSDTLEITVR
jgi:uncharacterized protein (DUF2141 family)